MYDLFYTGDNDLVWEWYKIKWPHAKRIASSTPIQSCAQEALTSMFWIIDDYFTFHNDWNFNQIFPKYDCQYTHIWPVINQHGQKIDIAESSILLIPTSVGMQNDSNCIDFNNIKLHDNIVAQYSDYDLFYTGDNEITYQLYQQKYPHIKKVCTKNTYRDCAALSLTKMFWVIPDAVEFLPNWEFISALPLHETNYVHIWPVQHPDSKNLIEPYDLCLQLWPTHLAKQDFVQNFDPTTLTGQIKIHHDTAAIYAASFDIFFVSYNEPNADKHWHLIKEKFPQARRIHGIKGINNAHRRCAELSSTYMFWTIDGDTVIDDNWQFKYHVTKFDQDYIHIWYSRNPVNGLEYGYGAIKLWPKQKVLDYNGNWLDYTTSVGELKIIKHTVATTQFNSSPYETWKSSLRESIKLIKNVYENPNDQESAMRLQTWSTVFFDVPFAEWAKIGHQDSVKWQHNSPEFLDKINDFEWLENYFHNNYAN